MTCKNALNCNFSISVIVICLAPFINTNVVISQDTKSKPDSAIVFARDIAPILVANCLECHNDRQTRASFSMATPEKLMSGGESGVVIKPGDADQSLLVRHIRGDEQPLMPNNRRALAEQTIENIAKWVKSGAKLDDGQSATATLQSLAWSADQIARDRLVRLSPDERTAAERDALGLIMARVRPTTTAEDEKTIVLNDAFGVVGIPDKTIATGLLTSLEKVKKELTELLKPSPEHPLKSSGRTLVFVFQRAAEFVEFQRRSGIETTVSGVTTTGRLDGEWPMIAILADEKALDADELKSSTSGASSKSRTKSRRPRNNATGNENAITFRSVDSLAAEAYTKAVLDSYPNAPAWLKLGLSQVMGRAYNHDPGYYQSILAEARAVGPGKITGGWDQRSAAFLKDQLPPQVAVPLAYALLEWLKSTQSQKLPGFVQAVSTGEPALDESLNTLWTTNRATFLTNWTAWLMRAGGSAGPVRKR